MPTNLEKSWISVQGILFLLNHLRVSCQPDVPPPANTQCAAPKNRDILLQNHNATIKIRKLNRPGPDLQTSDPSQVSPVVPTMSFVAKGSHSDYKLH